jgi:glucose/arabinose dehydrogenase
MTDFLAVGVAIVAIFPLAFIVVRMLVREAPHQTPINKSSGLIALAAAGGVLVALLAEEFFGARTIGIVFEWIVDTYPSAVRRGAQAPVTFIVSTLVSAIAIIGIYGAYTAIHSEVKRGIYFLALSFFAMVGLYEASSGKLFIGSQWLGQSVWPLEFVANHIPPIFGIAVGVIATFYILRTEKSAPENGSNTTTSTKYVLIFFAILFVVAIFSARIFFTASENIQSLKSLPVNAVQRSLPENFIVSDMTPPRTFNNPFALEVRDDGVIFIATSDGIFTVHPEPGDFTYATVDKFSDISNAFGMHWHDGRLLVAAAGELIAIEDKNLDSIAGNAEVLISDLPAFLYSIHANNDLIVNADGVLLMTLGGTSDHGPELSDIAGSVITSNLDGSNLTVVASGLRNPYGITECPNGDIFVADNGPDAIDERLIDYPPDEINRIAFGMDYGYPDTFGYPAPYDDSEPPTALLPQRAGSAGLTCYDGTMFPSEYSGDLFVALFGTRAGGDGYEGGRKVVRVELDTINGFSRGRVSTFATGFGHPVDADVYIDGSLLIVDYEVGQIFRISYLSD